MKIENLLLTYENLAIVRKICPVTEKYLTNRGKLVRVLEVPLEKEKIGLDQELLKMSTEVVRINSLKGSIWACRLSGVKVFYSERKFQS